MKHIYILLALSFSLITSAQNNAFQAGEKLTFTAGYNMSGLMTDFAEVTMEASEVKTKSSTLLRLKCKATTYSKWDNFFKIRDLYESYVNPKTLTPYLYKREIDEGGHYKFVKYNFNHKTKSVKSLIRKKSKNFASGFWDRNETVKISGSTKDLVTTIYHLRSLDIKKANIGDSDTFTVLFDNKETKCSFTYVAKETINTALGKKECYKLRINLNNNDALKGNSNFLWLTADENKIPVYAKFKAAVGNGELKIKSATGLKINTIMRLLFIILGLISAILAVILAVLPLSNFAFFPAISALIFGVIAFLKGRKDNKPKHTVQLIFLLTIIALALATFKSVTATTEVGDTEQLEQRDQDSEADAIKELNEELDDIEITD